MLKKQCFDFSLLYMTVHALFFIGFFFGGGGVLGVFFGEGQGFFPFNNFDLVYFYLFELLSFILTIKSTNDINIYQAFREHT